MRVTGAHRRLAVSLLVFIAKSDAFAQGIAPRGVIDGVVSDTALVPIRGAVVFMDDARVSLLTGANGRFRILAVPPGAHELRIHKLGFAPAQLQVEASAADTIRLAIALEASSVILDSVRIVAAAAIDRLAEFEERRARGGGQYLTMADIERRNTVNVIDLLIPLQGVGLQSDGRAINRRFGASRNCPFQVFIDDVKIPTPNLRDDTVSPRDLAGIEVYTSIASVPLRFRSSGDASACGVILLWTKRGAW